MTTKTKKTDTMMEVKLPAKNRGHLEVTIRGLTPLLINPFRETSVKQIEDNQRGAAQNTKEARDPDAEYQEMLKMRELHSPNGSGAKYGHPSIAVLEAMASAGHRFCGLKNQGKSILGNLSILSEDGLIPIAAKGVTMKTDPVHIKNTWTIAYRPIFQGWRSTFTLAWDRSQYTLEQVLNMLDKAGRPRF